MDIVIVGLIAILGNEYNKRQHKHNKTEKRLDTQMTIDDANRYNINKKIQYEKNFQHNNMVPFIKSKQMFYKPGDTVIDDNNRRLELFTGNLMEKEEIKKREMNAMFKPQKNDTATVHHINPINQTNLERYVPSDYLRNDLPFDQQRIGPGLGTDAIAKGGFHDTFRVVPDNINSYKVHKGMKGRVIFGKSSIDNRTEIENESKYFDKTTYLSQRPLMESKAIVNGSTYQNTTNLVNTMKSTCKTFENPNGLNPFSTDSKIIDNTLTTYTRDDDHCKPGFIGNPSRQDVGSLNENTTFIVKETDRGQCGQITNVTENTKSIYSTYDDVAKNTLRQTNECNTYNSNALSLTPASYENDYTAKHVKREYYDSKSLNPGTLVSGVKAEPVNNFNLPDNKRNQIDEKQMKKDNMIQGVKQVPMDSLYSQQTILNDKRTSISYTPSMSRVNILPDACFSNGKTILKPDSVPQNHVDISNIRSINNFTNSDNIGYTHFKNSNISNDRLNDFKILKNQMKHNPFVHH